MYSKLIDLYTFDITEMKHIQWMVCVITILKILENYWKNREGNPITWKYFGQTIKNRMVLNRKTRETRSR